jgi:hypothetical protein
MPPSQNSMVIYRLNWWRSCMCFFCCLASKVYSHTYCPILCGLKNDWLLLITYFDIGTVNRNRCRCGATLFHKENKGPHYRCLNICYCFLYKENKDRDAQIFCFRCGASISTGNLCCRRESFSRAECLLTRCCCW